MKNNWRLLFSASAIMLLLAACGTDTDKTEPIKEPTENATGVTGEDIETDVTTVEEDETEVEGEVQAATPGIELMKDAKVITSDEQAYQIAVLPEYSLTSEEPGRDSLISSENEEVFMRIETAPKEEGTYDYLLENMGEVLSASAGGNAPKEVTDAASLPTGDGIENAKVQAVESETGTVTGIIYERGDMIVRLTIYDSTKNEHFEKYLRMGETVQAK